MDAGDAGDAGGEEEISRLMWFAPRVLWVCCSGLAELNLSHLNLQRRARVSHAQSRSSSASQRSTTASLPYHRSVGSVVPPR